MVRTRLKILVFLLAFPFCIAFGRLAVLQLMPSFHREALQESRGLSIDPIPPERGAILARDGEVLAGNVPVYGIRFVYSQLNPRDRLVEILADELGEAFEDFYDRERIEERILELARPEELATRPAPPDVIEPVPSESEVANATASDDKCDDRKWIFLIGPIHPDVKKRIVSRWNKSDTLSRAFLKFCPSANPEYFDLSFSREDIVRQEIVLLRLARLMANGDASRWQGEYDRLIARVREVRAGYENLIKRDLGPAPNNVDADAYSDWKADTDSKRSSYHGWESVFVKNVSLDVVTAVEKYPASFTGLSTRSGSRRVYPENEVCGSLLGYLRLLGPKEATKLREAGLLVKKYFDSHDDLRGFEQIRSELRGLQDRTGASGLERRYDKELRGLYGGIEIKRGRRYNHCPPVHGVDITTTIDLPLQRALHEELTLASVGTSLYKGNAASAVVIDVSTGALLACAGVPSFDPNRMRERGYGDELEARWGDQTEGWFGDRPTRYSLFPGSVFKIVLAAAALESAAETGFSPRNTTYPCKYEFPHFKVHCSARNGHGREQIDLVQALKYSCNIYFFSIGYLLLTPQRIEPWARKFGFGRRPGIDLAGGGQIGRLDAAEHIQNVGVCHYSIGQVHVQATPLQVARSLCVIASGGELPRPYLVKPPTDPPEIVKFTNPDTVRLINDGLWRAAHEPGGTASRSKLKLATFRVALKTGTAEVRKAGEDLNHAWLVGYAPAASGSEPRVRARIAFAVVVEETRGHGADVCAPIVERLLAHFASSDPDAYSLDGAVRQAAGD